MVRSIFTDIISQILKLRIPRFFWYWQNDQVNRRFLTPFTAPYVGWNQTGEFFKIREL